MLRPVHRHKEKTFACREKQHYGRTLERQKAQRGIDTKFRGEIRLISADEGAIEEYIARFTDGALALVRPLSGMPGADR